MHYLFGQCALLDELFVIFSFAGSFVLIILDLLINKLRG